MRTDDVVVTELLRYIDEYANLVCYEEDDFRDDLIHDCIAKGLDIINGDINQKLSAKDIFNGWIKKYFDTRYSYYKNHKTQTDSFYDMENKIGYTIDPIIEKIFLDYDVEKALCILTDREKFVIRSIFGIKTDPKTIEEIGKDLCLTRERIRQIRESALSKLRLNTYTYSILKGHY